MVNMKIIQSPDLALRRKSTDISFPVSSAILTLAANMEKIITETERNIHGIAAVQLGNNVRLIAVTYGLEVVYIVNPIVTKASHQTYDSLEGCMSINSGKSFYWIKRHKMITVKGFNLGGIRITYKGRDIFGKALQHEIDHLDGIMIDQKGIIA